jgi:tetratricopeptide (TPR) repeat protein
MKRARNRCKYAMLLGALGIMSGTAVAFEIDYDARRPEALRACDDHQYRGRREQAIQCYTELLASSGDLHVKAESAWRIHDVRQANDFFRELIRAQPDAVYERIRWGQLYVQAHQHAQAVELFKEALERAPNDVAAKLGLARVFADRFEGGARALVDEILEADSSVIGAHLLSARMSLEESKYDEADTALSRATKLASRQRQPPLEIDALKAALDMARGRDPERWLKQIRSYNPRYGVAYEQLAHFEIMRRRYTQATERLRQAVAAQPDLWSAHAELGLNLMRLGNIDEARAHLTTAYSGDPFSPIIVNSLRLLDRIDEFALLTTSVQAGGKSVPLQLRLHKSEAPALEPYVTELARAAIDAFSQRYRFELKEPVTLELYPDHDDFAVRVAALPGIGLLGVTFGYVVAMDSPSGRRRGEFHWGSTLWHELAHVFTLEATDHRVPRWLSEGISVFEEWRTGPTPGVAVPPELMQALKDDQLLPIEDLDSGFIRPSYPSQIHVSYMQAGLVCSYIEQRWGFERLAALLHAFTDNVTTVEAIRTALKIEPAAFDRDFAAFLRERFARTLVNWDEWKAAYAAAAQAIEQQRWSDAIEPARKAVSFYPEHVGPDSPALLLAQALDKAGRRPEAIAALQAYRAAGGWDPDALRELATWLDQADRANEATDVLATLNYADPLAPELHLQLGERFLSAGRNEESLREFRVLQSMRDADRPQAHFGAARALRALGDTEQARRELLDALADAPHFRPAQALLLETIEERSAP